MTWWSFIGSIEQYKGLKLIWPWVTTGSLASYDNFEFAKFVWFKQIYCLEVKNTITGTEHFLNKIMPSKKVNVNLPNNMYNLLMKYYNVVYNNLDFFSIEKIFWNQRHSDRRIVIQLHINQFKSICIRAEIFKSTNIIWYLKNSYILAKFIQENRLVKTYSE